MRRMLAGLVAGLLFVPAFAQYTGPGSQPLVTSLQAVLSKPVDDQQVTLRGRILRQVSGDKYIFSDGRDEIRVEIDDKLFAGKPVSANTLVEISGEVEKDFMESPEIDVDALRIIE
ncbi:MAG: hypothetical protein CGU28_08005 [Candidatus Dactylopiibacterium carminicum]|uniref:Uncharacterized protein n=1 Tax=Candidatus Dactylopiibacterium carminicum TaxID=857335 RepID=A0A272ESK3_9RHOO|nr:NirD/YgiW/YdeI family stress tolerance protein [Candidatus Dactylopiibacterium carminicum]KAF7599058.1 hypothetical protein BGI27_09925 [Candidatus Dactylopiibacterium carminicum]PAS93091.1 MAG: hypothetical protein CGU29_09035 [Candidatus Dactylopiibacterium carminicum]PAS96656.1 MAG: hypothetical protein CGU28_08005 [Candidatus Dactylopiibacterium carminicum]PAS99071.1 MAG: hypothetical protein BSR46_09960 [Candidatus Dactylopiibacterium carminicum]